MRREPLYPITFGQVGLVIILSGAITVLVWASLGGSLLGLPFMPGARYSDAVTSHLPALQYFSDAMTERGEFPLWRETFMGGQPFAANPLNKTAYPLQWLMLMVYPTVGLNVLIAAHGMIGAIGMWWWARAVDLRPSAALIAALAFGLSPRLIAQLGLGHLDLWYGLAWFPWLMASLIRLMEADRATWRDQVIAALMASLVLLADVRAAALCYVAAGAVVGAALVQQRTPRLLLRCILPGILTAGLTLSVTLPVAGWLPLLTRSALTAAEAGSLSIDLIGLIGLVLPAHLGQAETFVYVGLPGLLLAIVGVILRRPARWWAVVAVIAGWYALGPEGGLWTVVHALVPGAAWFRVPGRAWVIVAALVPLLAGYGIDALVTRLDGQVTVMRRRPLVSGVLVVGALICGGLGMVALGNPLLPPSMGWSAIVFGGGGVLLLAAALLLRLSTRWFVVAAAVLIAADLLLTASARIEWRTGETWADPYIPLADRLVMLRPDRLYSPTYSIPQQVAEYDYLRIFGGIDPFQIASVSAAIAQAGGIPIDIGYSIAQPPLTGMLGEDTATANRSALPNIEILAQWGVSHVVAAYPIEEAGLAFIDQIGADYVYLNTAYRADWARDSATGWPRDWPGRPSGTVVADLNALTAGAALFSAVLFAGIVLFIPVTWLKRGRHD